MESYRLARVPASPRTDEGARALILNADIVFRVGEESVIEIVSQLEAGLSRRRLSNIVKELLKDGRGQEVGRQIKELLAEMKNSRSELKKLFERFGGRSSGDDEVDYVNQPMMWAHLN